MSQGQLPRTAAIDRSTSSSFLKQARRAVMYTENLPLGALYIRTVPENKVGKWGEGFYQHLQVGAGSTTVSPYNSGYAVKTSTVCASQ